MKKYEHGGAYADALYDFSANINPLGMPLTARKILSSYHSEYEKYPDIKAQKLVEKLSEVENIGGEYIYCSCGADDIIYRIVNTVRPKKALLVCPCFSEYEKALSFWGCHIDYYYADEKKDFRICEDYIDMIDDETDMLFLCCPNNPNGLLTDMKLLLGITEKCREHNCIPVFDMSFIEFCEKRSEYRMSELTENGAVIIRAFTKIYAMPGLRAGYVICRNEELLENIRNAGQCWSMSVPAQLAAYSALCDEKFVTATVEYIKKERKFLSDGIEEMGAVRVYPSDANFLLLRTELPLYDMLIKKKTAVRKCGNFRGLDDSYFRIAVRTHEENELLLGYIRDEVRIWQDR